VNNGMIADYNTRLKTYRLLFTQYEKNAGIHNYILERNFDRPGVYAYIQQNTTV
jgi:hypothetical protein